MSRKSRVVLQTQSRRRRIRAPLTLATFGGLEIGMPLAVQVRTGVIQTSESLGTSLDAGCTSTFWRKSSKFEQTLNYA